MRNISLNDPTVKPRVLNNAKVTGHNKEYIAQKHNLYRNPDGSKIKNIFKTDDRMLQKMRKIKDICADKLETIANKEDTLKKILSERDHVSEYEELYDRKIKENTNQRAHYRELVIKAKQEQTEKNMVNWKYFKHEVIPRYEKSTKRLSVLADHLGVIGVYMKTNKLGALPKSKELVALSDQVFSLKALHKALKEPSLLKRLFSR